MPKLSLPVVLSLTGGYVDAAGYLALQGLFTAHVTGNFVTLGATLAVGAAGALAKLLALPVFCVVVALARVGGILLARRQINAAAPLLAMKVLLLALGGGLAIVFGPFTDGDGWRAILTGMILVSAMAIQNAVQRIHFASAPPSTLMTGTTTQIVVDGVDLLRKLPEDQRAAARARIKRFSANVLAFAAGCGCAALLFYFVRNWCFLVPPFLAVISATLAAREHAAAKTS
jgi:uncharacterized membrane protein YoaK (UPF0700 family)